MNQYIKDKKIEMIVAIDKFTPLQNEMVKVVFEDGSEEVMPKLRFELIVTEEISTPSEVKKVLESRVAALIFGTLHEYGAKLGEFNGISDAVVSLINNGFRRAEEIVFGHEYTDIPLIEVNDILLKQYAKEYDDGTTPLGGGVDPEN